MIWSVSVVMLLESLGLGIKTLVCFPNIFVGSASY